MNLEEKVMAELKEAMKAKDTVALDSIRAIKSAILLAKTDGTGKPIDDAREIQILQKLVKSRRESLEIYEKQGRTDLAATEKSQIAVIEKFLPAQMSPEEVEVVLKGILTEVGATSPKDMGKVMGAANQKLAGKADGRMISEIVKKLLN
ncbi:MAG: GatB/YqeY domain-containing protein [Saprospiraceae bacterium]|nr:GatB/YqeY domain-containing protein [Saprospiraceae bacterium]